MGRRAAVVALLLLLGPASTLRAQGLGFGDYESAGRSEDVRRQPSALQVGGHTLLPSFNVKLFGTTTPHVFGAAGFGYTSNLLRADPEAPGPLIRETYGRFEVGARLDTQLGDHIFELDARGLVTEYLGSGEYDTVEGRVAGRVDLLFTDVDLHADLSWARSAYPQSVQLTGIVRLDTYAANVFGEGRVGRFGVRAGGCAQRLDFAERENEDLDLLNLGANLQAYGRITPKLRALVEYNYSQVVYDEGSQGTLNDYGLHQVRVGVDGELTEKLTASLKIGGALQQVREDVNPDEREFRGLTAACSVQWQALPNTSLYAGWARTLNPSVNSNFLITDSWDAGVTQRVWEERIELAASVGYSHSIALPGRHLNMLRTGASASWRIRDWLSVRAQYDFQRLVSSFTLAESAVSDYTVHEVSASVGVGF